MYQQTNVEIRKLVPIVINNHSWTYNLQFQLCLSVCISILLMLLSRRSKRHLISRTSSSSSSLAAAAHDRVGVIESLYSRAPDWRGVHSCIARLGHGDLTETNSIQVKPPRMPSELKARFCHGNVLFDSIRTTLAIDFIIGNTVLNDTVSSSRWLYT